MSASSAASLLQVGSAWSTSAPTNMLPGSSAPCRQLTASSAAFSSAPATRPRQVAAAQGAQRRHISTSWSSRRSLQARSAHHLHRPLPPPATLDSHSPDAPAVRGLHGLPPVTTSASRSPEPPSPAHTTRQPQPPLPSRPSPWSHLPPVQLGGLATTGRDAQAAEGSVPGTDPGVREVTRVLSLAGPLVAAGVVAVGVALCGPGRAWAKDKAASAAATAVPAAAVESVSKAPSAAGESVSKADSGAGGVAEDAKVASGKGAAGKADAAKAAKDPEKNDMLALTLRKHLERHPTDVSAMRHLLQLRMLRGDMVAAIEVLDKLVEQEPSALEWQFIRAQAQEVAGQLDEARQGFEAILAKEPFSARALQGLSTVMLKSGEEDAVLQLLQSVTEAAQKEDKKQEVIDIKLLVAQVLMRQGNLQAALGQYRAVSAEDPSDFRPLLCEGLVHAMLGDADAAEESFGKFREICPEDFPNRGYLDEMMLKAKVEARRLALQGKQGERKAARGRPTDGAMQQPGRQPVEVVVEGQQDQ